MECVNSLCEKKATRIMAMPPGRHENSPQCFFIGAYCAYHAEEVQGFGGLPAAGPALSVAASKIEGIRRA
jgi:hypothetical protein